MFFFFASLVFSFIFHFQPKVYFKTFSIGLLQFKQLYSMSPNVGRKPPFFRAGPKSLLDFGLID